MLDYIASRGRVRVRILAYRPKLQDIPDGHLKVVIQAMEDQTPIAEDPLHSEIASTLDLAREFHLMRNEGWEIVASKAMLA